MAEKKTTKKAKAKKIEETEVVEVPVELSPEVIAIQQEISDYENKKRQLVDWINSLDIVTRKDRKFYEYSQAEAIKKINQLQAKLKTM